MVKILLDHGADMTITDLADKLPADYLGTDTKSAHIKKYFAKKKAMLAKMVKSENKKSRDNLAASSKGSKG
jgi:hypothetical protein